MNSQQERKLVYDAYSSDRWKQRVNKMSESQVHAIYIRLIKSRKIVL